MSGIGKKGQLYYFRLTGFSSGAHFQKKFIYFQTLLPSPNSYSNGPFLSQMPLHPEVLCVHDSENILRLRMLIKADTESKMQTFQPDSQSSKCITVGVCIAMPISFYRHILATNSLQTAVSLLGTSNNVDAHSYNQPSSVSLDWCIVQC